MVPVPCGRIGGIGYRHSSRPSPARGNRQARNPFPRARVSTGSGIRERSGGTPVFTRFTPMTLARKLDVSAAFGLMGRAIQGAGRIRHEG